MISRCKFLLFLFCLMLIAQEFTLGTLSKSDRKKKKEKHQTKAEPSTTSVMDRGLVKEKFKITEILKQHKNYCELEREIRHFKGAVLGYVTPWNGHGYNIAKLFHKKFTLISPVWLQVKVKSGKYYMAGAHDMDKTWSADVTRGGENSLVPRVLFDGWRLDDFQTLFESDENMIKCATTITTFIKKNDFHGVTLELWSQMPIDTQVDMTHFLIHLSDLLHHSKKILVLVIPPAPVLSNSATPTFKKENFDELKDSIDYFSVMTYDYHNQVGVPAPIAPIEWIQRSLVTLTPIPNADRRKLLLGLHFYGIQYTGEYSQPKPILGHELVQILAQYSPKVKWQDEDAEHAFVFTNENGENVYLSYPTLHALQKRLDLATSLGTGIAIWEIGQGLDYFYDLL